jgi:hypothetical protein
VAASAHWTRRAALAGTGRAVQALCEQHASPATAVRKVKRATRPDDLHRPCGVNHGGVPAKNGESARSADQREPNNHCTANSTTAAAQALITRAAHR